MGMPSRYEVVDTIATGDFATVYRARDRELGREVAIKQIHHQFLTDQQQLARYWQEAQLLASLQHPNIVTIYDIVRSRGWLILELMQDNLAPGPKGEPIDLDFLRVALAGCLGALQFLHQNGVIHGDVKPGNMLVDAQGRVKLGDFGLARRASNEQGSLLKGTTKYMAPELLSAEFGRVGPPSDLYSLGFSAYELICGSQFETLFPTLANFGRDKQIAWMMWQAAPDQHPPEIGRVLEGVPEDLARVIQKLVVKEQSGRYRSAEEVLADLRYDPQQVARARKQKDAEALAAAAAAAKKKRRLRIAAIVAMCFSLVLCVAMLLPERPQPPPAAGPEPARGVVREASDHEVVIEQAETGQPKTFPIGSADRVFINRRPSLSRDLQPGDRAVVEFVHDESGGRITEIYASRPVLDIGHVATVKADEGKFTLAVDQGDRKGGELVIDVPADLEIVFNPIEGIPPRPVKLSDLRVDDRVVVRHLAEQTGPLATQLTVERVVEVEGVVRAIDEKKGRLSIAVGQGENLRLLKLPLAAECEVTLNGRREMQQKTLAPADLRPGDKVTLAHDTQVVRVNAYRVLGDAGVIRRVQYDAGMIDVEPADEGKPVIYIVRPPCKITLGGETAKLADLRIADRVDISHDSPGAQTPGAISLDATRPADRARWAILIANQDYDDSLLSPLKTPVADATLLRNVLVQRYAVPLTQAELLADESRVRLQRGIPDRLARLTAGDRIILCFAGHAYQDEKGTVYLAAKDFDLRRKETTGLPLQWLVDQFEQCKAKDKLLLLDCSHAGSGDDLKSQPSTAEMLRTLKAPSGRAPLRTVTAIAACAAGQRGGVLADKGHGLFPWLLAEAYRGAADKNRDCRLEPTELFTFLGRGMASIGGQSAIEQTPELFLPDARPPRLSEDARKAIRRLAALLPQDNIKVVTADLQYSEAVNLAGSQPEPLLLYGMLLLKARKRDDAITCFEELKVEHPGLLVPLQGIVWARFEKGAYKTGVNDLVELVSAVPKPAKPQEPLAQQARELLAFAGRLRGFLAAALPPAWRPAAEALARLDDAVESHGPEAMRVYRAGYTESRETAADYDKRIAAAADRATTARLTVERRQLIRYATFPFRQIREQILAGLDQ